MNENLTHHRAARHRGHRAEAIRLPRPHRWLLYTGFLVLVLSGCAWLMVHYLLISQGPYGPAPHSLEPLWLKIHGAAAMAALVGLGSLTTGHIRRAWHVRRNRMSGGLLLGLFLGLTVTGYLLYYFGGESLRPAISFIHWVGGLVAVIGFAVHLILGRNSSRHSRDVVA